MNKKPKPQPKEDLTGEKFERWTVKGYDRYDRQHYWNVQCKCGTQKSVKESDLRTGASRSCGCLAQDVNREKNTTHGETVNRKRSPEFRAFSLARNQCTNPRHENYEKFGGKGIEFRFGNFEEFLQEVGRKPDPKYVLTRKDGAGHYEAGNVEWTKNKNRIR